MTAITVEDLDNAKLDVDHIADIATSTEPYATDRMGHTKLTVSGAMDRLVSINFLGEWQTATTYAVKDAFSYAGVVYVAVIAHTSTSVAADLADGKIGLYQGISTQTTDEFIDGVDYSAGISDSITLSRDPGSEDNVDVFFGAAFQGPNTYSVTGTTLLFDDPIPVGVAEIFVKIGALRSAVTPSPNSVGEEEISWGLVLNRVTSSIAELRTLDKNTHKRAFVTGYYVPSDGGGGPYQYDPSDTTSADNGGTIIVAADGGRWKLQVTDSVSIKQFGAKMDDANDDLASIQAAIDWALSLPSGGSVHVPVGTARVSGFINVPMTTLKSFSLIGEGSMSRFRATVGMSVFKVGAPSAVFGANFVFKDIAIVQGVSGSVTGIELQNANSMRIVGCDISSVDNGIIMNGSYNVRITENRIYGCGQNGISTFGTGTNGTYIYDNVISTCGTGVNLAIGGNNIVIRDNDIEGCGTSIGMNNYTSVKIEGNYIENNTAAFFFFGGTNYEIDITQNWFGANAVSTALQNIVGGSFSGNTIYTSAFNQPGTISDFMIGHNLLMSGATIPTTKWTQPPLINGYSNVGGSAAPAAYIKDRDGIVHVQGLVTAAGDNAAFVLPVGYRPENDHHFAGVAANGTVNRVTVSTSGAVSPVRGTDATMDMSTVKFSAVN